MESVMKVIVFRVLDFFRNVWIPWIEYNIDFMRGVHRRPRDLDCVLEYPLVA